MIPCFLFAFFFILKIIPKPFLQRLSSLGGGGRGGRLLGVLALCLAQRTTTSLAASVQDGLAILVHLQLDNQALCARKKERKPINSDSQRRPQSVGKRNTYRSLWASGSDNRACVPRVCGTQWEPLRSAWQRTWSAITEIVTTSKYLGRMDADGRVCAVGLVALDALNVDDELLAVALDDLAGGVALVVATDNL